MQDGKTLPSFFPPLSLPFFLCFEAKAKIHFPGSLAAKAQVQVGSCPDSEVKASNVKNKGCPM